MRSKCATLSSPVTHDENHRSLGASRICITDPALWQWTDASDNNTVDIAGLPPGQRKLRVDLVNANRQIFPGCAMCSQTVTFTVPETASIAHPH